jgi:hypothetical protein
MEADHQVTSWKGVRNADEACSLIDRGIMLRWRDMRSLQRALSPEDEREVLKHFARRFLERADTRLQAEFVIESVLVWLAYSASEDLLLVFLGEFFAQPGAEAASWQLVDIALTGEISESKHGKDVFEMAVALICELGVSVQEYELSNPGDFKQASQLLSHIATYLLSVANTNSACIRLSLVHYFGVIEHGQAERPYFNKILSRFGHTVLDHLFYLLFRKRSEGVALQYLLENLPHILESDSFSQKIVHETFKFYMLKQPERFSLFLNTFAKVLVAVKDPSYSESKKMFLRHVAALLQVASELNHKNLAKHMVAALVRFDGTSHFEEIFTELRQPDVLRRTVTEILERVRAKADVAFAQQGEIPDTVVVFRTSKRGRKPQFSQHNEVGTLKQVTYLGAIEMQDAS